MKSTLPKCCLSAFVTLILILAKPSLSRAKSKCEELFTDKEISLPLEQLSFLGLENSTLRHLLKGSETKNIFLIGKIAEKIQSPEFAEEIAYSLRRTPFDPELRIDDLVPSSTLPKVVLEKLPLNDEVVVANTAKAFDTLFEGRMEMAANLYMAAALGKMVSQNNFLAQENSKITIDTFVALPALITEMSVAALKRPHLRSELENIFNDENFRAFGRYTQGNSALNPVVNKTKDGHRKLLKTVDRFALDKERVRFSRDSKSVNRVALILSALIILSQHSTYEMQLNIRNLEVPGSMVIYRNNLINGGEVALLDIKDPREFYDTFGLFDFLDWHMFETPLPLEQSALQRSLRKAISSDLKAIHREFGPKNSQIPSNLFSGSQSTHPTQRVENLPAQSKKRRANSHRKHSESTFERDSNENGSAPKKLLSEFESLEPQTLYPFQMLRDRSGVVYQFRVSQKVLDTLDIHGEEVTPFLKAVNYGFTSRDGAVGIKRIGINYNTNRSLYYVRPGRSSYRMILLREGDLWTAMDVVHKDDVNRTVDQGF